MANLSNINNILRISSSGVGLNKDNTGPSELDIESAGADMIDMTRTGQKTYRFAISGSSDFSIFDVAANDDRLVINSAGDVGIGTTSPAHLLQVRSSYDDFITKIENDLGSEGGNGLWVDTRWNVTNNVPFKVTSNSGNAPMMIIKGNGHVGIGISDPLRPLHVIGQVAFANAIDASSTGALLISCDGTSNKIYSRTVQSVTGAHPIDFIQNSSTVMRIDSGGNVGIGTTNPYAPLHVSHSLANGGLMLGNTATTGSREMLLNIHPLGLIWQRWVNGAYQSNLMTLDYDGNLGIGTTSPDSLLHLASSFPEIRLEDNAYSTNHYSSIDGNGGSGVLTLSADSSNTAANSTMIFKVDATERMRITSGGGVSIGSSNPSLDTSLRVFKAGSSVQARIGESNSAYSTLGQNSKLRFQGRNTADTTSVYADIGLDVDNQLLIFNDPGTTGGSIGTNPMSLDSSGNLLLGAGIGNPYLALVSAGGNGGNQRARIFGYADGGTYGGGLQIQTRNDVNVFDTAVTIDHDKNVGIGTTDPDEKLVLYKPISYASDSALYSAYAVNSTAVDNNKVFKWRTGITGNQSGHSLTFSTLARTEASYAERMRITSGGYVQAGNITNDTFHEFAQKTTNAQWTLITRNTTTLPYGLLLKYSTSPNNADQYPLYFSDATAARFYMQSNGSVYNNGTYGTISDRKLKENIVDSTSKLDDINKLKVRNFNFKDKPEEKHIGFIAQEFEEVFPKAVETKQDKDDKNIVIKDSYTKTIKTSILIPMLVKAIQELKADNDSLKARIETLENK